MGSSLPEQPEHGITAVSSVEGATESSSPGAAAGDARTHSGGAFAWAALLRRARPRAGWHGGRSLHRIALEAVGLAAIVVGVRGTLGNYYRTIGNYDEGVLLTNAHLLLRGELPYRDFYSNYPPGIFAVLAGWFAVFEQSVAVERWLGLALHLAIAALAGRVAGRALGVRFSFAVCGLVACWLAVLGLLAYAWLAGLTLALLASELWAWAHDRGSRTGYVLAGVTLGGVSWFRHDLFIYFSAVLGGFAVAWAAARLWRGQRGEFFARGSPLRGVFHVAGAALATVLLLWVPVFAVAGLSRVAHDLYFDQAHYTMPARVLPLPSLTALGSAKWSPFVLPAFVRAPFPAAVLLTLIGPVLAVGALLWPRRAGLTSYRSLVCPAALAIAVMPQMLGRTDLPHAVFAVTPALIAGAIWVIGGPERRWSAGRSWGLVLPALVLSCMPLRDSFVGGAAPKPQRLRAELSRAGHAWMPSDWRRAVAFVRQHTGKDDPLFVGLTDHRWTRKSDMVLYFLADRVGATRYMQFDPNLTNREDVQRSMIEELERTRPRVALLAPSKRSSEPNESRKAGSTLLDGYLRTHYAQAGRAGPLRLMLRRPELAAPPPAAAAPPAATAAPSVATATRASTGTATP